MTSTRYGPELDRLAVLWSAQPTNRCFAALADALRKRGALDEASAVAAAGVASLPDYLPGHLVMARILRDQGRWDAAEAELVAAATLDAGHPVVLDALAEAQSRRAVTAVTELVASSVEPAATDGVADEEELLFAEDDGDDVATLPEAEPEPVLTESLAMLYRGQGHLEQAVDVLDALVARTPGNAELAARRDAVRAELEVSRPRPFAAPQSGGRPVREWLAAMANSRATSAPPSSFDAFYQTPQVPPSDAGDLAAFQAWLRELDR